MTDQQNAPSTGEEKQRKNTYHPTLFDDQLMIEGFPILPMGEQLIIRPVDASMTLHESGLVIAEGKDNQSRIARVVAISPDMYNNPRWPNFRLKPGSLVYYNHLRGNMMRLRVHKDLKEYYTMYPMDLFSEFVVDEKEFFGRVLKDSADGLEKNSDGPADEYKEAGKTLEEIKIPSNIEIS